MKIIQVKVKPRSPASRLDALSDGIWAAQLKAAPLDGRANEELVALVAAHFGCRRSAVSIKLGASSRMKWVKIDEA